MNSHVRGPHNAIVRHNLLLARCWACSPHFCTSFGALQILERKGRPCCCTYPARVAELVLSRSHTVRVSVGCPRVLASARKESGEPLPEEPT